MVSLDIKYSYECAVNIEDLVKLSDVMVEHSLGPNGGKPNNFFVSSLIFIYIAKLWIR